MPSPRAASLRMVRDKYLLRWSTHAYKMEYNGFFSNHLLHGITALSDLGASDMQIDDFAGRYVTKLCVVNDRVRDELAPTVLVDEAKELLGKRQNFEGLREMYDAEIKHITADGAITQHLPGLVGGLAGSLLHGIIQLGYAYRVGGDQLIAEGLAYLHFSHLSFDDAPEDGDTKTPKIHVANAQPLTREAAHELARSVQEDKSLLQEMYQHLKTPAIANLACGSLQPRLMCFSSDPNLGDPVLFNTVNSAVDTFDFTGMNGVIALDFALWLYAIAPQNDFVLLHATTSAWALQQVEHLLAVDDKERAWRVWFRMALSAFIMHEVPPLPAQDPCGNVDKATVAALPHWDEIIHKTLALEGDVDEHVYKLVQVAHEVATRPSNSAFLTAAQREFVMKSAALKVISTEFAITPDSSQ